MHIQCAWCGKFRMGNVWRPLDTPTDTIVSHGVCPECAERLAREWGLEKLSVPAAVVTAN